MAARNPSCCTPNCLVTPDKCCRQICSTLCVSLIFPEGNLCNCTEAIVELEWNASLQHFSGTLSCGPVYVDVAYFLDSEDDECWLKLRSTALGYPSGGEFRWKLGGETCCGTLVTDIEVDLTEAGGVPNCPTARLTTKCVPRIAPLLCSTCDCVCNCLCVRVPAAVPPFMRVCRGQLCWDEERQAYASRIACTGLNRSGDTIEADIEIAIRPRGEYDPYASPYDTRCVAVLNSYTLGFTDAWQPLDTCDNGINLTWTRRQDGYPITVTTVCETCAVPCHEPCCDRIALDWPDPISGTLTVETDGHCTPFLITFGSSSWVGKTLVGCDFCDANCDVEVRLTCLHEWSLQVGCPWGEGGTSWGIIENFEVHCDPFEVTADFIDPYGPDPGQFNCGNFHIRITEAV